MKTEYGIEKGRIKIITVPHEEKKWEMLKNFAGLKNTGQCLCRFAFYEAVYKSCEIL